MLEKKVKIDDGVLHYWTNERPGKKVIFFLHGAGLDHHMFSEQIAFLDSEYRIIAWDARLHGESKTGFRDFSVELLMHDVLAVLDAEKVTACTMIGQSMGGNIAQELALRYPARVEKLILIDTTRNIQALSSTDAFLISISRVLLKWYPWNSLVKTSAAACSSLQEVREYVEKCFFSMGKASFLKVFFAVYDFIRPDTTYTLPADILLLCGEDDRSGNIKKSMTEWGHERGRNFQLIPGAAHNANQDKSSEVNSLIKEFLS